ncbi:hypothetical protein, partial [Actinomadura rubrisoli]
MLSLVLDCADGGSVGCEVELEVHELQVSAVFGVDRIKYGLEEIGELATGVVIDEAPVGYFELVAAVLGGFRLVDRWFGGRGWSRDVRWFGSRRRTGDGRLRVSRRSGGRTVGW